MSDREDESRCAICGSTKSPKKNPIVFCDGKECDIPVHKLCYGIGEVPDGDWFCERCGDGISVKTTRVECCGLQTGALKRTTRPSRYIHVLCAKFLPETREQTDVYKVDPDWQKRNVCDICHDNIGMVAQCEEILGPDGERCTNYFHISCGADNDIIPLQADPMHVHLRCQTHYRPDSLSALSPATRKRSASVSSGHSIRRKKPKHVLESDNEDEVNNGNEDLGGDLSDEMSEISETGDTLDRKSRQGKYDDSSDDGIGTGKNGSGDNSNAIKSTSIKPNSTGTKFGRPKLEAMMGRKNKQWQMSASVGIPVNTNRILPAKQVPTKPLSISATPPARVASPNAGLGISKPGTTSLAGNNSTTRNFGITPKPSLGITKKPSPMILTTNGTDHAPLVAAPQISTPVEEKKWGISSYITTPSSTPLPAKTLGPAKSPGEARDLSSELSSSSQYIKEALREQFTQFNNQQKRRFDFLESAIQKIPTTPPATSNSLSDTSSIQNLLQQVQSDLGRLLMQTQHHADVQSENIRLRRELEIANVERARLGSLRSNIANVFASILPENLELPSGMPVSAAIGERVDEFVKELRDVVERNSLSPSRMDRAMEKFIKDYREEDMGTRSQVSKAMNLDTLCE